MRDERRRYPFPCSELPWKMVKEQTYEESYQETTLYSCYSLLRQLSPRRWRRRIALHLVPQSLVHQ